MLLIGEVHGDRKQGAGYGYSKKPGYHPIAAVRADTGEVLTSSTAREGEHPARTARFVDELFARARAGNTPKIIIRADTGFENHKLIKNLPRPRIAFSIGVKISKTIRELIARFPRPPG